jgi:hypothetical protein
MAGFHMRIVTLSLFACSLALSACGGDADDEGYDTLQACYDDHHLVENLPVLQAIATCCLNHPIMGVAPSCEDTVAACVTHVEAELDSSVTTPDIQAACTEYVSQRS